jgi:hypothetical protein
VRRLALQLLVAFAAGAVVGGVHGYGRGYLRGAIDEYLGWSSTLRIAKGFD